MHAELINTNVDSVALAFRFKNMIPAKKFIFPGNCQVPRNRQITILHTGQSDGELERVCKLDGIRQVPTGKVQVGEWLLSTPQKLYGYVCWDSAGLAASTFETVFTKTIIPPGGRISYDLMITRLP